MRLTAAQIEIKVELFGSALAFMEKLDIIETAERWKLLSEPRNAVNHGHDENPERLTQFFAGTLKAIPELFAYFQRLLNFCANAYRVKPE